MELMFHLHAGPAVAARGADAAEVAFPFRGSVSAAAGPGGLTEIRGHGVGERRPTHGDGVATRSPFAPAWGTANFEGGGCPGLRAMGETSGN
jgi:hypothetical protein